MILNRKAVVLLSGGLDSTLAIRILQEQGIEIEALNIRTVFGCCKDDAVGVAARLGVKVTVTAATDEYFKLVEKPKYGRGKGINPCVDCRIYMFRMAKKLMMLTEASFVATGEVLGQRPMSQQMHQLDIIEEESGLKDILLRPLSAKLLEPTQPEREGIVDRNRLYAVSGRSRKELLALARKYDIDNPPVPSTGCVLTEPDFARKVQDVFDHRPDYERWDFETLNVGRHFRLNDKTKVILGRNQEENDRLELLHRRHTALLIPFDFRGPSALVVGELEQELVDKTMGIILHYTKDESSSKRTFEYRTNGTKEKKTYAGEALAQEELAQYRI
uniref:Thiamine biosynthesis protein n=1 Tax=uncultured bacterium W4-21b TaxID=1130993 RepID=H9BWM3_9BACT|nr:thiamine biosynthesis protein [uncultured bacterium W4-21b]